MVKIKAKQAREVLSVEEILELETKLLEELEDTLDNEIESVEPQEKVNDHA